jgi:site-specific DNA-methyltransferase (adenine-specific)
MLWCSKGKNNKFTFNYKTMKALNNDKQEKSVWNIGICQGNERLKNENNEKLHNTQKPQSLLEKIVLATSKPNDLILDPFFGTGTTGAAAKKYKRNYIGIDNVQKYIDGATQRINDIVPIENEYSNGSLEVKPPKVSLQTLIDNNYLQLNETFYDKNGKEICKLLEKDKVQDNKDILSIHKMSAKYRNKNNSNGWDYFYVKRNNNFVSINNFRYEYDKKKKET